ncbi:MAG: hypothetical protein HY809_01390 [Nitrospirae bacterium]|nr:hypothetical protein [Nitrospirota bacterium]
MFFSLYIIISGCGAGTLSLKHEPLPGGDNLLAAVPSARIKLLSFIDSREGHPGPELAGGIQRNVGGPVYDIMSERPVPEVVHEALKTELIRSGHKIVEDNEDFSVKGEIKTFWLRTEPAPDYVVLRAEAALLLEVINSGSGSSSILGPYNSMNMETRFIGSDDSSVSERILVKALGILMQKIGADSQFATALRKK